MKLEEYIKICKENAEEDDLSCFIAEHPEGGYTNTYIPLGVKLEDVRSIFKSEGIEIIAEINFYKEKI